MRALTLTQPWAGLVASGIKLVENRPRHIIKREDFGVPFAIHASREIDRTVYERIAEIAPDVLMFDVDGRHVIPCLRFWPLRAEITSAVIGVATIDRVLDPRACGIDPDSDEARATLPEDQRRWFFGPVGYVLRDVRALSMPVICKGALGFWTLPGDVEAKVCAQLQEAA